MEGRTMACGRRLLAPIAIGALLLSAATISARAADTDGYSKVAQVDVPSHAITCNFPSGDTNTTGFSFDISWVAQARGEYLLAERSHGRASHNTEGGRLSGATTGDLLLINTDDPGASPIYILPPRNDPFAGHRCDENASFGGLVSRNEIEGPNGVFTVNDTEAWVGDGPSYFTPGQTNSAADYKNDPCDSSVRVFSLTTRRQIDHINVHGCFRTDEGAFDPVDQIALFANPSDQNAVRLVDPHARPVDRSPFITLISTSPGNAGPHRRSGDDDHRDGRGRHEILTQINFDGTNGTPMANGGIEQAVYSRQTGLFYIAVPSQLDASGNPVNDGWVVTVDPRHHHHFDVASYALPSNSCDGGPAGAALGPNHQLLLGCGGHGGEVVVNDITQLTGPSTTIPSTNATILPDGSTSCDEVAYDAGSGHFGGACFVAPAFGVFGVLVNDAHTLQPEDFGPRTFPGPVTIAHSATIPGSAAGGAHSIAADSVNEEFWMPKVGGDCGSGQACVAVYGLGAGESDFSE